MNSPPFSASQRNTVLWILIGLALIGILWLLRPVITPFLLGAILAYILRPGVVWLTRKSIPRSLAALSMMLLLLLVLTLLLLLLVFVVQREGPQLKEQIPLLLGKLHDFLQPRLEMLGIQADLNFKRIHELAANQFADNSTTWLSSAWKPVWSSLRASGSVAIAVISNLTLTPLVLYYLLYDWNTILQRIQSMIPRRWLPKTTQLAREIDILLSQYLRGQLLVMAVLAFYYTAALTLARFEIALPLGIFTGLAVFIPYIGFTAGLVLALLAALLQFSSWYGIIAVAIIYGLGQIMESFYLTPRLVGERIGMHPLTVIFALLAFGQLFGFFGVLLALPISAITLTGWREIRRIYLASTLYRK